MAVVVTEKELEEACASLLPDEKVLAVGLFQPYGAMMTQGAGMGTGMQAAQDLHVGGAAGVLMSAAAGFAARRGLATVEHQPPWTAMAVTEQHVYAFDASDHKGGTTATHKFSGPPYATWERNAIAVHVSRHVTSFTLSIDDAASGQSYEYTGNKIYKVGGKLVAHLLTEDV
jgi:hypothetical protein